jgi:hypothetical protein
MLNPLTNLVQGQGVNKRPRSENPLANLGASPAPMQGGTLAYEGIPVPDADQFTFPVNPLTDYHEIRAQNQTFLGKARNSLVQGVIGEIVGGTLEGVGYLFDLPAWVNQLNGSEQEWGNWLSDIGKGIRDGTAEALPIHLTNAAQSGSGRFFESSYWFSHAPSILSTLSLLIPAAAAGRAATLGINAMVKGMRAAKAGQLGVKGAQAMGMGDKALWATNSVSAALFSRHMENTMEAARTFDEKYKEFIQKGHTDEEARQFAGAGAALNYRWGYINLITDIPQYAIIFKGVKFANRNLTSKLAEVGAKAPEGTLVNKLGKIASNSTKGLTTAGLAANKLTWTDVGKSMIGEGVEEWIQEFLQNEGGRWADKLAGIDVGDDDLIARLNKNLHNEQAIDATIFGALGGGLFAGAGKVVGDRSAVKRDAAELSRLISRIEGINATMKSAAVGAITGNPEIIENTIGNTLDGLGLDAAHRGRLELEREVFDSLSKLSDTEIIEGFGEGLDLTDPDVAKEFVSGFKENARRAIDTFDKIADLYDTYSNHDFGITNPDHLELLPELIKKLTALKLQIDSIEQTRNRLATSNELNTESKIKDLDSTLEKLSEEFKNLSENKDSRDAFFNNVIETRKKELESLIEQITKLSDQKAQEETEKKAEEEQARRDERLKTRVQQEDEIESETESENEVSTEEERPKGKPELSDSEIRDALNDSEGAVLMEDDSGAVPAEKVPPRKKKTDSAVPPVVVAEEEAFSPSDQDQSELSSLFDDGAVVDPTLENDPEVRPAEKPPSRRKKTAEQVTNPEAERVKERKKRVAQDIKRGVPTAVFDDAQKDSVRKNPNYATREGDDGVLYIVGVRDPDTGEWTGEKKIVKREARAQQEELRKKLKTDTLKGLKSKLKFYKEEAAKGKNKHNQIAAVEMEIARRENQVDQPTQRNAPVAVETETQSPNPLSNLGKEAPVEPQEQKTPKEEAETLPTEALRERLQTAVKEFNELSADKENKEAVKPKLSRLKKLIDSLRNAIKNREQDNTDKTPAETTVIRTKQIESSKRAEPEIVEATSKQKKEAKEARQEEPNINLKGDSVYYALDFISWNNGVVQTLLQDPDVDLTQYVVEFALYTEKEAKQKGLNLNDPESGTYPIKVILKKKDKAGRLITVKDRGVAVEGWFRGTGYGARYGHYASDTFVQERAVLIDTLKAGRRVFTNIVSRGGGRIPYGVAADAKNNVLTLLGNIRQENAPFAITDHKGSEGYGSFVDGTGKEVAPNFGPAGQVWVVLENLNGTKVPIKLNVRELNQKEADLITEVYTLLVQGKLSPNDVLNLKDVSGIKVIDFLNLLVYETNSKDIPKSRHLSFDLKTRTLTVGDKAYTAKDIGKAKAEISKHIRANKKHQVRLGAIGDGKNLFSVVSGTDQFTLFGKTYVKGENDSYIGFIASGSDPIVSTDLPLTDNQGKPLTQIFTSPQISLNRDFTVEGKKQIATEDGTNEADIPVFLRKQIASLKEQTPAAETPKIEIDLHEDVFGEGPATNMGDAYRLADRPITEAERIDAEAERNWILQRLPQVAVEIIDDLIQASGEMGATAWGVFRQGMITLSRQGVYGTGFHEAFHAVFRTYLSDTQQEALLQEARAIYGDLTVVELEEHLAEAFREYVETEGRILFGTDKVDGFFKKVWSFIKSIFTNRYSAEQVFDRIIAGKYANAKPVSNRLNAVLPEAYRRINGFTQDQVYETIQTISYLAFKESGLLEGTLDANDISKLDLNKGKEFLMQHGRYVASQLKALVEEGGSVEDIQKTQELLNRLKAVIQNWSEFESATKHYLRQFGITEAEDLTTEEYGSDVSQHIREKFEYSGKDSATSVVKLFLSLRPKLKSAELVETSDGRKRKDYEYGSFLNLPRLNNYGILWNKIERALQGTLDLTIKNEETGEYTTVTAFEQMLRKLEEYGKRDANVAEVAILLTSLPEQVQTQFHFAFSKVNQNFHNLLWDAEGMGLTVKLQNANTQEASRRVREEWINNFKSSYLFKRYLDRIEINQEFAQSVLNAFNNHFNKVRKLKGDVEVDTLFDEILPILRAVGITITKETLRYGVEDIGGAKGKSPLQSYKTFISEISTVFTSNEASIKTMAQGNVKNIDRFLNVNPISNENIVLTIAGIHAEAIGDATENTVLGPDNKSYWVNSAFNGIMETIIRLKEGDITLDKLLESPFNANSYWLTNVFSNKTRREKVEFVTFLKMQEEDSSDTGNDFSDLQPSDELVMRLNMVLNGLIGATYYPTLNMADKGRLMLLKGLPFFKSAGLNTKTRNLYVGSDTLSILRGYLMSELTRMSRVHNEVYSAKGVLGKGSIPKKQWIANYHYSGDISKGFKPGNAFRVNLFPEFNFDALSKSNPKLAGLIYNENGTPREHISEEAFGAIDNIINTIVVKRINEQIQDAIEKGLVNQKFGRDGQVVTEPDGTPKIFPAKGIQFLNNRILQHYEVEQGYTAVSDQIKVAIADYVVNSIIANFEQAMIFHGDWAMYKSLEDMRKRTPAAQADGPLLRTDATFNGKREVKETFTVGVMKDSVVSSEYHAALVDQFTKLIQKHEGLSKTFAKAKAVKLLEPYTEVNEADGQGYITIDRFREIQIGLGRWSNLHETAFKKAKAGESLDWNEMKFFMQPIKGVHFELTNHYGNVVPVYLKYSQAVLFPALVRGSELETLYETMQRQKLDEVVFESGIKVGARDPKVAIGKEKVSFTPIALSNSKWRLQVDLPTKEAHATLAASQQKKNILANIELDSTYTLDGKEIRGSEFVQAIHNVYRALSMEGTISLLDEWGVPYKIKDGEVVRDGDITNHEGLHEMIMQELIRRQAPENLIESLDIDSTTGRFLSTLSSNPFRQSIQNIIFSVLNKRTVKNTTLGGSYIQVSAAGLTKPRKYSELTEVEKSGAVIFNREALKPPRMENGEFKPGGVLLPSWFGNLIGERFGKDPNELTKEEFDAFFEESPELKRLVSYRIPNQGKNSIDVVEVAGFLPREAGDTIVMYNDVTAKTGSDFDIDKMYVMLPNYDTVDGRVGIVKYFAQPTLDELDFMYRRQVNERSKKQERDGIEEESRKVFTREEFNEMSIEQKNGTKALENRIIDLYAQLFNDERTFLETMTPLGSASLKPLAKEINALVGETEVSEGMKEFSPRIQQKLKQIFSGGKSGVGLTANHLSDHAISQLAELFINIKFALGNTTTLPDGRTVSKLDGIYNVDGVRISDELSAVLDAFVDIAKDPYIFDLNMNTYTANIAFMMLRAGLGSDYVFRFIRQPILVDLAQTTANMTGEIMDTFNKVTAVEKVRSKYLTLLKGLGYVPDISEYTADMHEFSKEDLTELLTESKDPSISFYISQLIIMNQFLTYMEYAKALSESVLSSKADTVGAGKGIAEVIAITNRVRAVDMNMIGNFANKFKDTMLGTYYRNSVENALPLMRSLFMEATPAFISMLNNIASLSGNMLITDEKLIRSIMDELYVYVISGSPVWPNEAKLKEYFFGKLNDDGKGYSVLPMAHRLRKLKSEKSPVKDNLVVRHLIAEVGKTGKSPSFIKSTFKKKGKFDTDAFVIAWEELLNYVSEDPAMTKEIQEFANDLIRYAVVSSGMRRGIFAFHELIPVKALREITNETGETFDEYMNNMMRKLSDPDFLVSAVDQVFHHNYDDNKLVRKVGKNLSTIATEVFHDKDSKQVKGFVLHASSAPGYVTGITIHNGDDFATFPPYLKQKVKGKTNLFRLRGYMSNGSAIYGLSQKKGLREKGLRIYEYQFDNPKAGSMLDMNQVVIDRTLPIKPEISTSEVSTPYRKFVPADKESLAPVDENKIAAVGDEIEISLAPDTRVPPSAEETGTPLERKKKKTAPKPKAIPEAKVDPADPMSDGAVIMTDATGAVEAGRVSRRTKKDVC